MSDTTTPSAKLIERWRQKASEARDSGAMIRAEWIYAKCADELEAVEREYFLEALTLEDAAEESGYSYSSLQKRIASGEIENAGKAGAPRVRRKDLPKKAKRKEAHGGIADRMLARRLGAA